jgi:hypothetical protein
MARGKSVVNQDSSLATGKQMTELSTPGHLYSLRGKVEDHGDKGRKTVSPVMATTCVTLRQEFNHLRKFQN